MLAPSCTGATVSDTQVFYDGHAGLFDPPGRGLATKMVTATSGTDHITTETGYDSYGRVVSDTDGEGNTTATTYAMSHGLLAATTTTAAAPFTNQKSTTTLTDVRRTPRNTVDPNGNTTWLDYDALGRLTAVHLPTETHGIDPASITYTYDVTGTSAPSITTRTLQDVTTDIHGDPVGTTVASSTFFDGWARTRETQTPAPGKKDGAGLVVVATRYDNRGLVAAVTAPLHATGTGGLVNPDPDLVPTETRTAYDTLAEPASSVLFHDGAAQDFGKTTTAWTGWHHAVTDAAGTTRVYTNDGYGRLASVTEGGSSTGYRYDPASNLTGITGADGSVWAYGYDLAGRRITTRDPDAGASSTVYDGAGNVTKTIDAAGHAVVTTYDALNRPTGRYQGSATGPRLAFWQYDLPGALGLLASSATVDGAATYSTVFGYDARDRVVTKTFKVPPPGGGTAESFTYSYGYDRADHLIAVVHPAVGGLAAETVRTGYSTRGYLTTVAGARTYVASSTYTNYAAVAGRGYGGTGALTRGYGYDEASGVLNHLSAGFSDTDPAPAPFQDTALGWDDRGNLRSVVTAGPATLNECFGYDGANRLVLAETRTGAGCAGPVATGAGSFHRSYRYDSADNLVSDRDSTDYDERDYTSYAYGTGGAGPHALTSITTHHWAGGCGDGCRHDDTPATPDTPNTPDNPAGTSADPLTAPVADPAGPGHDPAAPTATGAPPVAPPTR